MFHNRSYGICADAVDVCDPCSQVDQIRNPSTVNHIFQVSSEKFKSGESDGQVVGQMDDYEWMMLMDDADHSETNDQHLLHRSINERWSAVLHEYYAIHILKLL
ncbi:hypothetical protein TNCV_985811 [Trichonephila clavipes]|uniref:Uncharacterized protein n=1 Tax=Trichonephila clavipes TaxID=2585209 RepID=A0A8X6VN15_TRICX|nr:hypothetical protein TNCV_985811 [Trichonephila clavipes]